MTSKGYALARAGLIRALTAYSGITTADGEADGTTLVDSNLKNRNDFITEKTILIMSGDAKDEDKGATSVDTDVNGKIVNGIITLQGTGFSAQIKAGTIFRVLNISSIEIDVANMDGKIGTSGDAAGTTTLFAWLAKLFASGERSILGNYGKVTTYTDDTHFKVSGLAGFGNDYFKDFSVYVVRDAAGAGAAPQGEMQPISDYVSSDGTFTHTAFTAALTVDDEVLILHPRLAEVKDLIDRLGAFTAAENLKAILGDLSTTKRLGQILGGLDETDTLKAILGAFTATENLKAILGDLSTTKNLGGILGAFTTAANLKAAIDAIKGAGWTDENLTTIDGLLDDIKAVTDAIPDAGALTALLASIASILEDTGTTLPETLVTIAEYIDTEVAAIKVQTDKIAGKMLFSMDFWSDTQEEVAVTSTAGNKGLPSVVIADLPDTAAIVRAVAMFKFRMVENIHATEPNNLVLDQYIQVKKSGQSYTNGIKMIDTGFAIAAATREGGDVIIGNIDLAAVNQVDANATYECQWTAADAAQNNLQFNDVQCGLRIWYSI